MSASPLRRLAPVLFVAVMVLTGCSVFGGQSSAADDPSSHGSTAPATASASPSASTSKSASEPTSSDPTYQPPSPPEEGTCRKLPYDALTHFTDNSPVVPCDKPHTAYTFQVSKLPRDVAIKGVDIANKSIQHAASSMCHGAFEKFVGGSPKIRALSRLAVTYYLPPQKAFNHGAHWVRCDLIAKKTAHSLGDLPDDPQGFLDGEQALKDYGVCSPAAPDTKKFALVMCRQKHAYRAVTAIKLGKDSADYPGTAVTRDQGKQRCADYITHVLGKTGGYTYGWTYPTDKDWKSGQRYGYCWLKTTH